MKNICYPMGGVEYSTTERVVGKWIDGKPLYQRVLTGTLASATAIAVDNAVLSDNTISLIYAFGRTVRTSDNTIFQIPYAQNANRNSIAPWMYSVYQQEHTIYIRRSYGTGNIDSSTFNYQLVIQYTKTTD